MSEPVLVVHGVQNHERTALDSAIRDLQVQLTDHRLIPVFWGDLGGNAVGIGDTLPTRLSSTPITRDLTSPGDFERVLADYRTLLPTHSTPPPAEVIEDVMRGVEDGMPSAVAVRAALEISGLREVLWELIPHTQFLRTVSDPTIRRAAGQLIAAAATTPNTTDMTEALIATRGITGSLRKFLEPIVAAVDQYTGRLLASAAGQVNDWIRASLAKAIAGTFGDIVAYHQKRDAIHRRLFDALDEHAPGHGSDSSPISVLAHSLGGLITLDAALGAFSGADMRVLHIKKWITLGSQPSFFHVIAPRAGLAAYAKDEPVSLPESIGGWSNLWHPMDPLAFAAAKVFRLANGDVPVDVRVDAPLSEIRGKMGWMHSVYWESSTLHELLKQA